MRSIHLATLGLALGLVSGLGAVAAPPCLTINSLNFNSGYVIQLVNNPQSVNPNAALNILTAQVTNNSGNVIPAGYAVSLTLNEPANPDNCSGAQILAPISLTIKKALPVGPSVLLATDFNGSGQATICQQFQDDVNNQFKNINTSNAGAAVTKFLQRRFQVVLSDSCSQASTFISIFNQPSGNNASPASLIMPADGSTLQASMPLFVWSPAQAGGSLAGFDYTLVLSLTNGGPSWNSVSLPTGQLFYKWQASDPALPAGQMYWTVISRDHASGKLVGGSDGQGHGRWFSFTVPASTQGGVCGYSLNDLDGYAKRNAGDQASLLAGMSLQRVVPQTVDSQGAAQTGIATGLADPDVCTLLGLPGGSPAGKVHLLKITVTRR